MKTFEESEVPTDVLIQNMVQFVGRKCITFLMIYIYLYAYTGIGEGKNRIHPISKYFCEHSR